MLSELNEIDSIRELLVDFRESCKGYECCGLSWAPHSDECNGIWTWGWGEEMVLCCAFGRVGLLREVENGCCGRWYDEYWRLTGYCWRVLSHCCRTEEGLKSKAVLDPSFEDELVLGVWQLKVRNGICKRVIFYSKNRSNRISCPPLRITEQLSLLSSKPKLLRLKILSLCMSS